MTESPKFCHNCGAPLVSGAAFCSACGTPVEAPEPVIDAGERRRITVMFSDLVGSTELAAHLDPEEFQDVVDEYYRLAGEAIRSHGGHIGNYLGDGVLAYFGYPIAYEDSAARAVRAGLSLQESIAKRNVETGSDAIAVRVGIHNGLVVIDAMGGPARREAHAMGDTVNMASRIQGEAPPGSVLVSEAVQTLVRSEFELEDRGRFHLKGLPDPTRLFAVGSPLAGVADPSDSGVFVGRERERAAVVAAWQSVGTETAGKVVLVQGEAGIGKSRLLRQVRGEIDATAWYQHACSEYDRLTPFAAVINLLGQILDGDSPHDRADQLGSLLAHAERDPTEGHALIADLLELPTSPKALSLTPSERRSRTIAWLAYALAAAAGTDAQGVLVLEDLHWADDSSLSVISRYVRRIDQPPYAGTLFLLTSRPGTQLPWDPEDHAVIALNKLPLRDIRTLITSEMRRLGLDEAVLTAVVERTDGVPLFAEELARSLTERGEDISAIPTTLSDSLLARLDRLGRGRRLAQLAAVLGREFDVPALSAIAGAGYDVEAGLQELMTAQVIRRSRPDTYEFRHSLVRDAAYESLLRRTRRELHGQVAGILAKRSPVRHEIVARHWTEAGKSQEAFDEWSEAARLARSRAAHVEAVDHLVRAKEQLAQLPASDERTHDEIEILIMLANSSQYAQGFGSDSVHRALSDARRLSEQLGDPDQQVSTLYGLYTATLSSGDVTAAAQIAEQLDIVAQASGDPGHLRTAALAMAARALNDGRFHEVVEYSRAALHARGGYEAMSEEFDSVNARLYGALGAANLADEVAFAEFADPLFARASTHTDDVLTDVVSASFTLIVQQFLADYHAILEIAETQREQANALGLTFLATFADIYGGWAEVMEHGSPDGTAKIERGMAAQLEANQILNLEHSLALLAEAQLELGDPTAALETIERSLDAATQQSHRNMAHRIKGTILGALGADSADVAEEFQLAIDGAARLGAPTAELAGRVALASWQLDTGRVDEAHETLSDPWRSLLSDRFAVARRARALLGHTH